MNTTLTCFNAEISKESLNHRKIHICSSGASCSKLTTSLVKVFIGKLDSHIFPTKNNSVFDYVVGIDLTS